MKTDWLSQAVKDGVPCYLSVWGVEANCGPT